MRCRVICRPLTRQFHARLTATPGVSCVAAAAAVGGRCENINSAAAASTYACMQSLTERHAHTVVSADRAPIPPVYKCVPEDVSNTAVASFLSSVWRRFEAENTEMQMVRIRRRMCYTEFAISI